MLRALSDGGMFFAEASRLFESVRHLQYAEVLLVAADDLQADRKTLRCETCRHGGRRIAPCRNVPATIHPVDVVIELHACDLRRILRGYVERRQLRGGQNEVLVFFEERLKTPPDHSVCHLGARKVHARQPQTFLDLAF